MANCVTILGFIFLFLLQWIENYNIFQWYLLLDTVEHFNLWIILLCISFIKQLKCFFIEDCQVCGCSTEIGTLKLFLWGDFSIKFISCMYILGILKLNLSEMSTNDIKTHSFCRSWKFHSWKLESLWSGMQLSFPHIELNLDGFSCAV